MPSFIQFLRESGRPGLAIVVLTGLAIAITAVTSRRTAGGWRFPAPFPVFVAALPLAIALAHGLLSWDLGAALRMTNPEQKSTLVFLQIIETMNVRVLVVVSWLAIGFILWKRRLPPADRGPWSPVLVGMSLSAMVVQLALGMAVASYGDPRAAVLTAIVLAVAGGPALMASRADRVALDSLITAAFCWALAAAAWWGAVHVWQLGDVGLGPRNARLEGAHALWLDHALGSLSVIVAVVPALGALASKAHAGRFSMSAVVLVVPLVYLDFDPVLAQYRQMVAEIDQPDRDLIRATGG